MKRMEWMIYLCLVSAFLGKFDCVSEVDIRACNGQVFNVVTCTSVNYFYRECIIPGADQVHAIKLHRNLTNAHCEFKNSFGYRGNAVWVTSGCSGEFYLCYDGVAVSTSSPLQTQTIQPVKTTRPGGVAVVRGSNGAFDDNNVLVYVIAAACVVLLVGLGLIVGCVVKRRQQNDTSRHLAEKRQIRIELKEHREHMEENGEAMLPSVNRSLSVESINYGDPVNYNYGRSYESEKEGSICSSRSSNSCMTSLSVPTTGKLIRTRPSSSRNPSHLYYGKLKKGMSTPDISVLGKMYCEANMSSKSQRNSMRRNSKTSLTRCSHSSLESVREVCNKYQVFDIPLEYKLRQQAKRSSKNSTVSFGVNSSDRTVDRTIYSIPGNTPRKYSTVGFSGSATERTCRSSLRISDGNRTTTKAIIHSRSPSLKDLSISTISGNNLLCNDNHISLDAANNQVASDSEIMHNLAAQQSRDSSSYYLQTPSDNIESRETSSQCEFKISRDVLYRDPTSLFATSNSPEVKQSLFTPVRPERSVVTISKPEGIYETDDNGKRHKPTFLPKPKPQILPKPSSAIYATVNKSYFKAVSKAVEETNVIETTCGVMSLEDDEDDAVSTERESQYARLDTFKGASNVGMRIPVITIPGLSNETTSFTCFN